MNEQAALEFQAEYEKNYTPVLPEHLKDYRFRACLREAERREIWLLEHTDGTRVICKHASGDYISMLRTEWKIKKFPFFPSVIDYYETETDGWLLREYIEGDTLEELVEKNGPLDSETARAIIRQLCQCLLQLHHANPPIIYRDLKPSNVVLTKNGEYYLIDLGSVRSFREGSERDTVLVGTVATAAPEQYGVQQTDARTDIYALGLLYSYLLTGELKKVEQPAQLPPGPEAAIIRKATAFDPDNRYQSVEELLRALDAPAASPRKKWHITAIATLSAAAVACCLLLLGSHFRSAPVDNHNVAGGGDEIHTSSEAQPAGAPDSDSEAASETQAPLPTDEVEFTSALMRQAVLSALGKADGEAVTYGELNQVDHLYVCGDQVFEDYDTHGYPPYAHRAYDPSYCSFWFDPLPFGDIQDLSLLAHMTNLHDLVLDFQQITDLSPLEGLPLTRVSLCDNPVTDLSPLGNCSHLTLLAIDDTQVSSLAPLKGLHRLTTLSITHAPVADLAPVSDCPIAYLTLGNNTLADFECLKQLPLVILSAQSLPKDALAPLSEVTTLEHLSLYECSITSLQELAGFDSVTTLELINNKVQDLRGIGNLKSLQVLGLGNNRLSSLDGLEEADDMQEPLLTLSIDGNPVEDFSALKQLPGLKQLGISSDAYDKLLEAIPDPWFEVIAR